MSLRHFHAAMAVLWTVVMPASLVFGWVYSIAFVSVISIYANMVGHFSSWQATRAEDAAEDVGPE